MKKIGLTLFLLFNSIIYSETINPNVKASSPKPKMNYAEIFESLPNDTMHALEYYWWLCAAEFYHEPLFQKIGNNNNIESYRFVTNGGEVGWSRFLRITKEIDSYTLTVGKLYTGDGTKRKVMKINLNKEEWDEALSVINDINQTVLYPPHDDFVVFDAGFTIFESIKDGEVRFTMRNEIFMATKERNLESLRSAERALRKLYMKAKRENRIHKTIDLEAEKLETWWIWDSGRCKNFLKTL